MRIDKFLKNSRIIKRRTVAKIAADSGRVSINGKVAKAGTEVNVDDIVEIEFGDKIVKLKVLELIENVFKSDADSMYKIIEDWYEK